MMEGISSEAASLAGHLKLANLCWIYDNNHITIEGNTALAFSEDVATRFIGYGWNVTRVGDANDLDMLERAFRTFKNTTDRPTLDHRRQPHRLRRAEQAGHAAPRTASRSGDEEIRLTKRHYGWPEDAKFLVPDGVREHFDAGIGERGADAAARRGGRCSSEYRQQYPELAEQLASHAAARAARRLGQGPAGVPGRRQGHGHARRVGQGAQRDRRERAVADRRLGRPRARRRKTRLTFEGAGDFSAENPGGRNLHFGIREHAMGAVLNGLALSKVRPYGSGFLIFSDYGRPAIRLARSWRSR